MYKNVNNYAPHTKSIYFSVVLKMPATSAYVSDKTMQSHLLDYANMRPIYLSTLWLWNNLKETIRNAPTLPQFKRSIRQLPAKPHAFHLRKQRTLDVILTHIRHSCSSFNGDLYRLRWRCSLRLFGHILSCLLHPITAKMNQCFGILTIWLTR